MLAWNTWLLGSKGVVITCRVFSQCLVSGLGDVKLALHAPQDGLHCTQQLLQLQPLFSQCLSFFLYVQETHYFM